jgi:hypothetical protein
MDHPRAAAGVETRWVEGAAAAVAMGATAAALTVKPT